MFKPSKGICKGNHKQEGCGNYGIIMTSSRGLCQVCESKRKPKKQIKAITDKQKEKWVDRSAYYKKAIAKAIVEGKGKVICEECGVKIDNPTGMNVSHIISGSSRPDLYLHPENYNILCKVGDNPKNWSHSCHVRWETGDKENMKIYPKNMETKERITKKP